MNYIFLDIDGVIKSRRSAVAFKNNDYCENTLGGSCVYPVVFSVETFNLDPICIKLIRNIVETFQCKIIITSCWRVYSSLEHFHQMFNLYGWDTRDIIIDFTPIGLEGFRGKDIDNWMESAYNIREDKYIIIDDNDDLLEEQKQYLIKTNTDYGFNFDDFEKAIKLLSE